MYVTVNEQSKSLQNFSKLYSGFTREWVKRLLLFKLSPRATQHCLGQELAEEIGVGQA